MQSYFSGRMLSADALTAEQHYVNAHRSLTSNAVAQSLAPNSLGEALMTSLPPSILDQVALNPQPLPPREATEPVPAEGPAKTANSRWFSCSR